MKKLILSLLCIIFLSGCANFGTNLEGKKCPDSILRHGFYQAFGLNGFSVWDFSDVGVLRYYVEETPDMWKILWTVDLDCKSYFTVFGKNKKHFFGRSALVLMDKDYMVVVHFSSTSFITCFNFEKGCFCRKDKEFFELPLMKEHFDINTIKWVTFGYTPE